MRLSLFLFLILGSFVSFSQTTELFESKKFLFQGDFDKASEQFEVASNDLINKEHYEYWIIKGRKEK